MKPFNVIEGVLHCGECGRVAKYIDLFTGRVGHCVHCEDNLWINSDKSMKTKGDSEEPPTDPWISFDSIKAGQRLRLHGTSVVLTVKNTDKLLRRIYFDSPIISSCDEIAIRDLELEPV